MAGKEDELDEFYAALKQGLTVKAFLDRYHAILGFVRSHGLMADYRLGKGRVKKLSDEVTPVARFADKFAEPNNSIRFNLSDKYPDCVLTQPEGGRDIEVTIAQGRERLNLEREFNETGEGRGFIGITDDQPTRLFIDAMERDMAASTGEVFKCVEHAVELCCQNKQGHDGDTLLIEAPLLILPSHRWQEFSTQLGGNDKVKALKFREVYLTGYGEDGAICFKLK